MTEIATATGTSSELGPLTLTETLGYVAGRIAAAGGVGAQIFTREAVMLIHERSRGIPRTISVIADNALLTGFALGRRPVSRAMVEEVCRDLDLRGGGGHEPLEAPAAVPPPARTHEAAAPAAGKHIIAFDAPPSAPPCACRSGSGSRLPGSRHPPPR